MAKSYFYDENISDWRELVKGEQGERGPVGPRGPQGPAIDIETGLPISVDTTVGTRVYVGDTMIYGDTGWRALELPDLTAGDYIVRRIGDTVIVQLSAGQFDSSGNKSFPRVPVHFRPTLRVRDTWLRDLSENVGGTVNLSSGGYLNLYYYEEGVPAHFNIRYETSDAWPTSLPGTPV